MSAKEALNVYYYSPDNMRNLYTRSLFILVVFSSGCTHLDLIPSHYESTPKAKFENTQPNRQIIVTRGSLYHSRSAIRVKNNDMIYFVDPSGSYGID